MIPEALGGAGKCIACEVDLKIPEHQHHQCRACGKV